MVDETEQLETSDPAQAAAQEEPALAAPPVYPKFPCHKLLMNAGIPIAPFVTPDVEVTETGVRYVIVTNAPNSSQMKIGLDCLRIMGCTVTFDHESMKNFTMITIEAPRKLFSEEDIEGVRKGRG